MVLAADDELVAPLAVGEQGGQVALSARGEEEGGLFAGECGDVVLEAVDGGVLAVDVVADVGAGHGRAHGGGGNRDGVAAKVCVHRGNASGGISRPTCAGIFWPEGRAGGSGACRKWQREVPAYVVAGGVLGGSGIDGEETGRGVDTGGLSTLVLEGSSEAWTHADGTV